jgi:hypothetical protein
VHLKLADQQLSTATSSENTVSPNAGSESSKVLMAMTPSKNTGAVAIVPSTTSIYNLILDGKTYPIKYQITGESNKLNYMTTKADKAAILANVTSQSTGKLIIELPRILLESKKAGTVTDIPYIIFGDGQYKVANEIKNNNNVQVRTLAIDFNKGTKQIEIDGSKIGTQPIPSTVSSSTLDHNPLSSSPVYIHKTTDINKNKIIVTTPQDSKKSKSKDPSLPYYDPNFPDKPANMPFCSQPKANANHKVCYDESDNPHPPCTKYPDNPACGTGKNVAGQGQPVKSCNSSQDSNQCITSIPQPKAPNPSVTTQPNMVDSVCHNFQSFHPYIAAACKGVEIAKEIFPLQPPTENQPIQQSSPIPGLLPSPTSDSPDNSVSPTDKSESSKRAEIDASRDTQGSNGHGYDSSCPSGHSAGFCGSYKQAYDKQWNDLHSSSPIATSKALTAEKPTTTAEQPIPTTGKSFQKSEPSGQEIAGTLSTNNPATTNPTTSGLADSNTPNTNPANTLKQDTGTGLSSSDSNSIFSNTQSSEGTSNSKPLTQPYQGMQSPTAPEEAAVPDQGQTTTSQDKGTSGSGGSDDSSGGNNLAPDSTTKPQDNTPTIRSTTPDQSVSGVQSEQGGVSAVVVPDKGQTTTTGQDQGTSGSGGSDDNSGSSGSNSGDSSTTSHDNNPPSDSSSTADRHSNSGGEKNSDRDDNSGGDSKGSSSGGGGDDDN